MISWVLTQQTTSRLCYIFEYNTLISALDRSYTRIRKILHWCFYLNTTVFRCNNYFTLSHYIFQYTLGMTLYIKTHCLKCTCQYSIRISHIRLHTVYYETHALLPITKSWIYYKEKRNEVKVVISYKYSTGSNTFLFDPADPKICHS